MLSGYEIDNLTRIARNDPGQLRSETNLLDRFGSSSAAIYDLEASRMPRRYKEAHKIQNKLVVNFLKKLAGSQRVVLDLGCGTASDGVRILSEATNAIYLGLDYSKHMLKHAKRKFSQDKLLGRSLLLEQDFRSIRAGDLREAQRSLVQSPNISVAISALALHHYEFADKRLLYRLLYSMLPSGGLFVLTDLFSNAIADCAKQALQKEISDIHRTQKRLACTTKIETTISKQHYIEENRPQLLSDEIALLMGLGFRNADVVYRSGQLSVVVSEK